MSEKRERSDLLPVITDYAFTGTDGNEYVVEIDVYETQNLTMFPEGVSGTFRLFKLDQDGERKLIYLIDNHAPYGFHEHDELPENHESRVTIHVKSWQEAWDKFQARCLEITK
jgi:hypothetical protein